MDSSIEITKLSNDNPRKFMSLSTVFILLAFIFGTFILMISETLLWFMCSFINNFWTIIAIYIVIHLLIVRHIITIGIFPGHNSLIKFYYALDQSQYDSKLLIQVIMNMKKIICKINDKTSINSIEDKNIITALNNNYNIFIRLYIIYQGIKERSNDLGYYANRFYIQLIDTYEHMSSSIIPLIIKLCNKKENNDTIEVTSEDKKSLHIINNDLNEVIELIKEFRFDNRRSWNVCKFLHNLFYNDIFWKKEYLRMKALTQIKCNYEEFFIKSKDQTLLDCVLLKCANQNIEDKSNIIIMCSPNLMTLEQMILSWDFNSLYLSQNIEVLLWNYRGYRNNNGSSNIKNVKSDIESIYDDLKKTHRWNKIGVHGISIGGVAACHLATVRSVDILIADRSLGSIDKVARQLPLGNIIWLLFKILCIPKVFNEYNYINANCVKIILSDPNDMIITEYISLKSAISQVVLEKIDQTVNNNNSQGNINCCTSNKNLINYALLPKVQKVFYSSLIKLITFMKKYNNNTLDSYELKKPKNIQKNQELSSLISTNCNDFADFFYNRIRFYMLGLESSGLSLANIIYSKRPFDYINIFINNLVIWGANDYSIEINKSYLRLSSNGSTAKSFNMFIKGLESIILQKDDPKYSGYELFDVLKDFIDCLKKIEFYMQEINIREDDPSLLKLKGILVTLSCGHSSFLKEDELDTLHYLLSKEFNNLNNK